MRQKIKADAIYGNLTPVMLGDPPQGCALACRYYSRGREYKIGQPWPVLQVGDEIEVETTNHYIWHGEVVEIRDEDTLVFRPSGPKVAMPLPPVVEGQPYRLPWMSGDAWSRRPEAGTILLIEDRPYKAAGKPKAVRGSTQYEWKLRQVDAQEYATRPGRVLIKDLDDPDPTSHRYCGHNVGRIVKIGPEFLHVEKVSRVPYGDGEGRTIFGHNTFGEGHFVPPDKAAKLDATWAAMEKVRSLEHSLKVARQDPDYGGNPDAIPGLEAALKEARGAVSPAALRKCGLLPGDAR